MKTLDTGGRTIAGVDGCKLGWLAVVRRSDGELTAHIFANFAELVGHLPTDAVIVVDMPIGLPDLSTGGGRIAEQSARSVLKLRRSSIFPIPSRSAIYLEQGEFLNFESRKLARAKVSDHAMQTSQPPRGVTFQAFSIFPKIRDIDQLLKIDTLLRSRVVESHPEVAFWRLNDGREMNFSKKTFEGAEERRCLLMKHGYEQKFLDWTPNRNAATDDFLDACVMLVVAARHARGEARPFPDPPGKDSHGIPVAIWA